MPSDLLLPAFVVTLAVNALLVALAIRALTRSPDAERPAGPRAGAPGASAPVADPTTASATAVAEPGSDGAADGEPVSEPGARETPEPAADVSSVAPSPVAAPSRDARPRSPRRAAPATDARRHSGGSRRRFALPPLDEDQEKVNRSIETFLSGSEAAVPVGAVAGAAPPQAVTVAALALVAPAARPETDALEAELRRLHELLERTVRSSARASDRVLIDRAGRVRMVLSGTGELAAHAWLRRIRAIVEPVIQAELPEARLVVATATEISGIAATARRRADRRLTAMVAAPAAAEPADDADAEPAREPRAAGD